MRHQLRSGVWVEGTQEQINAIRVQLGEFVEDGLHYNSSTHGVIRISSMDDRHIKNAIRKIYRAWVDGFTADMANVTYANRLSFGPKDDVTLLGLIAELNKRKFK